MDKRTRRRKRKNAIRETMDLVKTILLIVMAVFVVAFVFLFIKEQLGNAGSGSDSKVSVFGSLFQKEKESTGTETIPETTVEMEEELKDGLNRDSEGHSILVRDGVAVKDTWIDYNNALYRFDAEGFAKTGTYEEDGFIYTASESGAVSRIQWNEDYRAAGESQDYPGLVQKGSLMVYLNRSDTMGRFQKIIYKKSTVSHQLGGESNPQYTAAGSIQIGEDGYIYWLPIVSDPDEMEAFFNGKLYRMQPDSETRQIVAEDVDGYRVLTGENGDTTIYYCRKSVMYRCGAANCRDDDTVTVFTEDMDYRLDLSTEGKLFLRTVSGYPVRQESEAFTVKGITYQLSPEGEILSVKESKEADLGEEGTWQILTDQVFGTVRSVVIWKDEAGVRSVISSEFSGTCGNIFYDTESGIIYAEYEMNGTPYILMISKAGDADMLLGTDQSASAIRIVGFDENGVVVQNTASDGKISYETVAKDPSTPIAVGTEPVLLEEQETTSGVTSVEQMGPGYSNITVGPGVTGPSGTDSGQSSGGTSVPGMSVMPGSGSSSGPGGSSSP